MFSNVVMKWMENFGPYLVFVFENSFLFFRTKKTDNTFDNPKT